MRFPTVVSRRKGGEVETTIADLGTYLRVCRDRLKPNDYGLIEGRQRRVSGLRRQEVAEIAGISSEYYLRLEQGKDRRPSVQVLDALARALRLDTDGRLYLFKLAGQAAPLSRQSAPGYELPTRSRSVDMSGVTSMLSSWTATPAYVVDRNQDVIAINELGRLFIPLPATAGTNIIQATVHEAERESDARRQLAWGGSIAAMTAALRFHADPSDERLQLLVTSLSARSRTFRQVWASHEARPLREGSTLVRIEPFGFIRFRWQTLEVHGGDHFLTSFFGQAESIASAAIEFVRARHRVEERLREDAILNGWNRARA